MLADLQTLLAGCARGSPRSDYGRAIEQDNLLGKPTASARHWAFKKLRELYSLDHGILVFGALVDLWDADVAAQPVLALLCVAARDPVLRATAVAVLTAPPGAAVSPQQLSKAVEQEFPSHYSPRVLAGIGQNTASTWQQSGHLRGKVWKVRTHPVVTPTSVSYALFLGYLCGARGEGLFETFWTGLLDASPAEVRAQALEASRRGWLEYRSVGGITELEFRWLLRRAGVGATP